MPADAQGTERPLVVVRPHAVMGTHGFIQLEGLRRIKQIWFA